MRAEHPIDDALASLGHVRVLRALFEAPPGLAFSGREVGRRAGLSHPRATEILSELRGMGLVRVSRRPRLNLYELNREHVLASPLEDVFSWERNARDQLLTFLRERILTVTGSPEPIVAAVVFGSVVWGEMETDSDVDVAIVRRSAHAALVDAALDEVAEELVRRYGNRLSPIFASPDEVPDLVRSSILWSRIVDSGVIIAGSLEVGQRRGA